MRVKLLLAGLAAAGLVGVAIAIWSTRNPAGANLNALSVPVPKLTAKGTIVPQRQTRLAFGAGGRIAWLGVELGDRVASGTIVARLEIDGAELAVRAAADAVALQQAMLDELLAGARPEEVAVAQAGYEGALAKYDDLLGGSSDADVKGGAQLVAAAQLELARAQNVLARLNAGVDPHSLQLAEQEVERARGALWAAQIERDGIKGNGAIPEFLGTAADARVMAAEVAVRESQTKLEQIRASTPQPEEIAAAEQSVRSAMAAVAGAEAKLVQMQSGPGQGDLAAARAAVSSAKAQLDLKRNGPSKGDVAVARVRLQLAETQLVQARQALANTELRVPYAATVTALSARAGEYVAAGTMVLTVADITVVRIETNDLDEYGAKAAVPGEDVVVSINAWPGKEMRGVVRSVAPMGTTNANGDAVFAALIDLAAPDPALRPGMTVKVVFGER